MRKILFWSFLVSASFLTFFLFSCNGDEVPFFMSDEAQLEALVKKQANFMEKGDWRAYYQTISPRIREDCPYETFLENTEPTIESISALYENLETKIERIEIKEGGQEATVYMTVKVDSDEFESYEKYEKVGGRWYDSLVGGSSGIEFDPEFFCE